MQIGQIIAKRAHLKLTKKIKATRGVTIREVESYFGKSHSWWRQTAVRRKGMTLAEFSETCHFIGWRPSQVLSELESEVGAVPAELAGPEPVVVRASRGKGGSADEADLAAARARLERLDERRYLEPSAVIAEVGRAMPTIPSALRPLALGVAGSSYRLLLAFPEAKRCLEAALDLAAEDDAAVGDIFQRQVYVYKAFAPECCPSLAEAALLHHTRTADLTRIGQALLDCGFARDVLQQWREALGWYAAAQRYSAWLNERNRVALYQASSVAHEALGNHHEAIALLEQAWATAPDFLSRSPYFETHLHWTGARIRKCPRTYLQTVHKLAPINLFDAACAAVELAQFDAAAGLKAFAQLQRAPSWAENRSWGLRRLIENCQAALTLKRSVDWPEVTAKIRGCWVRFCRTQVKRLA